MQGRDFLLMNLAFTFGIFGAWLLVFGWLRRLFFLLPGAVLPESSQAFAVLVEAG